MTTKTRAFHGNDLDERSESGYALADRALTYSAPERYGEKLMELALKLLRGESVPPAVYVEHIVSNADNLHVFYPE
jgi:hypothetical protein